MLVGRANEIAILDQLVAGARVGKAGVIVLRGEAGIGKTALLSDITDRAAAGIDQFMVLRVQGHEVESHVSFGGLLTLLEPIMHLLPELPEAQGAALSGALRLRPAAGGDRLGVATAILGLIAAAAEHNPLLLSIDDAHWLDLPSLEAIVFASRRLQAERAAVILAARPEVDIDPDAARWLDSLPTLTIAGLTEADARELLARHGYPLDPGTLRRHLFDTMGNPLALIELCANPDGGPPVAPLAIGRRLEEAFGLRLRRCPQSTRRALLLLAVCGGETDMLQPLLETQGLSPAALEPAEIIGLVTASVGTVRFRHPLMRSAVYQLATPGERREAHRAMALLMASLGTPGAEEREVWHLAAATTLPDEQTAARLEGAAESAAQRRSYATAMDMYKLAGRLSPPGSARAGRMLNAADLSMQAGRTEAGLAILEGIDAETTDPQQLIRAVHVRCRIEMWGGKPVVARDRLLAEGMRLTGREPIWSALMLSSASLLTVMLGELPPAMSASAKAVELVGELPDRVIMPVLLVHALALASRGECASARRLLDRCRPHLDAYDPLAAEQVLLIAGLAFDAVEDPAEAHRWYRRAVESARDAGAVGLLPFQLSALAWAHWRQGAWAAALSTADEATRLAEETGWRTEMPNSLVALAQVEAGAGRDRECRAHIAEAIRLASGTGARIIDIRADIALALLDLGAMRPAEAAGRLDRVAAFTAANGLADPVLLSWAADAVEAGVRASRPRLAETAYAVLRAEAERSGRPSALARAARCRALLTGDPRAADAAIAEALDHHARANWPFEEARTWLVHGELLRRNRQRARARAALERGADMFQKLGAEPWADRAADELRAVGGATRPRPPAAAITRLTPQETTVALVVASGATNAEAAARLFLSQKTIEYHLSSVYRKLGIRSRNQLAAALNVSGAELDLPPAAEG